MPLKTKLTLSFLLMLLLTIVTAYMGWRAMEAIERQAIMSSHVENSLTSTLLAQTDQLMFTQTKDKTYVDDTRERINISMREIQEAQKTIWEEGRKKMAAQIVDFLNWYKGSFENLVTQVDETNKTDHDMVSLTDIIVRDFTIILENIRESVKTQNDSIVMEAFQAAYEAEVAFTQSRLLARSFVASPSQEQAALVVASLQTALKKLETTRSVLRQPRNLELCDNITQVVQAYLKAFGTLRDKTLANHAKTMEIRDRMDKNLEVMRSLSSSAANSISVMRASSATQMFITAALALLLGVGVALGLSRNVQKQLGKDPGQLAAIAARVSAGDFKIADNSPEIGVYGNIVAMVHALEGHIESARSESQEPSRNRPGPKKPC